MKGVDFSYTAGTMLSQLFTTIIKVDCNGVDDDNVRSLDRSRLSSPRYAVTRGITGYTTKRLREYHHIMNAGWIEQSSTSAIEYAADLSMMKVTTLTDAENFDATRNSIEEAGQKEQRRPIKRYLWRPGLNNLSSCISAMERYRRARKRVAFQIAG